MHPNGTGKRAAIYCRVSSEEQGKGYSPQTQIDGCRDYCARLGYEVAGEFVDEFTGTAYDRPGLNALREVLAAGGVDVVVSWDLDRLLGRDELGQVLIKHEILGGGARIEYARDGSGHSLDPSDNELLTAFKQIIARQENADRIERTRRGQRGRAEAGYVLVNSGAPYGYDLHAPDPRKGELVINDAEAAVVRDMYAWLIFEGLSTHTIAQRLHELEIPTRGDQKRADGQKVRKHTADTVWNPATVRNILSKPVYKGEWAFGTTRRVKRRNMVKPNGTLYKTSWKQVRTDPSEWVIVPSPALVDIETWERAQERLAENKRQAKPPKYEYLLRGMIYCTCGKPWMGNVYATKSGAMRGYYRCRCSPGKPWRGDCDAHFGIRKDVLEAAVWEFVSDYMLHPDRLMTDVERRRREEASEREKAARELRAVDIEIRVIDRRLSELLDQVLDGFPAEVVDAKKRELVASRTRLGDERNRLEARHAQITMTPDVEAMLLEVSRLFARLLPRMTFEERRQLLRLIELRVDVLDKDTVKVSGIMSDVVLSTSITRRPVTTRAARSGRSRSSRRRQPTRSATTRGATSACARKRARRSRN